MPVQINTFLDAAILRPEMNRAEVTAALELCRPYKPRTVCVRPGDITFVKPWCEASGIGLGVVLGFPHGSQLPASKVAEARAYVRLGVDEIDMVANIGWIRSGAWRELLEEVREVASVTREAGVCLKVIMETALLEIEEIHRMVAVCIEAGADFVKTSTGFNGAGASDEAVRTMLEAANGRIKVKPSGGIRDAERAKTLIAMGAQRLGVGYSSIPALCDGKSGGMPESVTY